MSGSRRGPAAVIVAALITAFGAILAAVITMSGGQGNGGAAEAGPTGVEPTPPGSSGTTEPQQAVMLADLQPVDGETLISTEPLSVNGVERTRPISFDLGCFEKPQAVTYQLGREYGRFDAVVGQSDASTEEDPVLFEVVVDGVTLFSSELGVGVQEPVGIDLSSAPEQGFRMTIQVDGTTDCDEDQVAAWIDATLTP